MANLIYIENPEVRNFCEALDVDEFSDSNIYENQQDCLTLFNLAQMRNPHKNFEHYFLNNQINFDDFPLFWPEEKLKIIKNSFMENTLFDMNLTLRYYSEILERSTYFPKYSQNDLKKAFILMNSQNFKIKIQGKIFIVMIPFMDIYKLNPITNVDFIPEIKDIKKGLILKAVIDIQKGSPLITNYGESDNANLLLNYGFTLKDNKFPAETEFFNFKYNGKNYALSLNMENQKEIFDTLLELKQEKILSLIHKKHQNKNNKNPKEKDIKNIEDLNALEREEDLKFFKMILKNLLKYSNKKRLENLSENILLNDPNINGNKGSKGIKKIDRNILRALNAENQLIEKNVKNILEIINILKLNDNEIKNLIRNNDRVYLLNKKYFDKVFSFGKNTKSKASIDTRDNNKKEKEEYRNIIIQQTNSL